MSTTTIPQRGDRFTVAELTGYRYHRPSECRPVCRCGECNGVVHEHPGTVERVIRWADNSIEADVLCDDGRVRTARLVAPHGDRC